MQRGDGDGGGFSILLGSLAVTSPRALPSLTLLFLPLGLFWAGGTVPDTGQLGQPATGLSAAPMELDGETDAETPAPAPATAVMVHQGGGADCRQQSHTEHKALYLAIAKFLSGGPCTAASQALISEMQTNGVSTHHLSASFRRITLRCPPPHLVLSPY